MTKRKFICFLSVLLIIIASFVGCDKEGDGKRSSVTFIVEGHRYTLYSVSDDGSVKLPEDPELEGHRFDGWYLDEEYKNPLTSATTFDAKSGESFSVYAKFTDINPHNLKHYAKKEASCLTAGQLEYWLCLDCSKKFADKDGQTELDSIVIPAKGHSYAEDWSSDGDMHWHASTCGHDTKADSGYHKISSGKCTVCDKSGIFTLKLGDADVEGFKLVSDSGNTVAARLASKLKTVISNNFGVSLEVIEDTEVNSSGSYIYVRHVPFSTSGGVRNYRDGFYAYFSSGSLYIDCEYETLFEAELDKFISTYITVSRSGVTVPATLNYTSAISTVTYADFGAKGDGTTDDFYAILRTHEYANIHNVKVLAKNGAEYYIGASSVGRTVPIKTETDFGTATFVIDDRLVNPFNEEIRSTTLFEVQPSASCETYFFEATQFLDMGLTPREITVEEEIFTVYERSGSAPVFTKGQTNIGLTFSTKVLISLANEDEKVYIRYGGNANNGAAKREVILVDKNGNVDPSTPILWDYNGLTELHVMPAEEDPITLRGGTFISHASPLRTPTQEEAAEGFLPYDQYYYYYRGFRVARSNTTVYGLTHKMRAEDEGSDKDGGYPYRGWLDGSFCNNVTFDSCVLSGHEYYVEDRDLNEDGVVSSDEMNKGTSMGTYDINAREANALTWKNCTQVNPIYDNSLWGIMGSNFVKNLKFDGCSLSRFDAHQGVCNAEIIDSTIGQVINIVGAGKLTVKNTHRIVGYNFINMRNDYGSTWEGDVNIVNCSMDGYKNNKVGFHSSLSILYFKYTPDHNFGYKCYLTKSVTVDNFTYGNSEDANLSSVKCYLFYSGDNNFTAASFTNITNPYQAPTSITVKNQTKQLYLCNKTGVMNTLVSGGKLTVSDTGGKLTIQ